MSKNTEVEIAIDLNRLPRGITRNHIDPWKDYDEQDVDSFLHYVSNKVSNTPEDTTVVVYGRAPTPVAMRVGALLYSQCDNVVHSLDFHGRKDVVVGGEVM
ncbi:hypothetical protein V7O66_13915 [Methanolobus sp. ZRKC3]|uniref:hypothetical protein n=1 Tax=Methanolobus sp. ZRKC3 TaxID=3125786 RepID=UPI0032449481